MYTKREDLKKKIEEALIEDALGLNQCGWFYADFRMHISNPTHILPKITFYVVEKGETYTPKRHHGFEYLYPEPAVEALVDFVIAWHENPHQNEYSIRVKNGRDWVTIIFEKKA